MTLQVSSGGSVAERARTSTSFFCRRFITDLRLFQCLGAPGRLLRLANGAAEILRRVYGEDDHAISITNPFNAAIANLHVDYSTFNEICNDIDDARIYGGIHFPFDQVAGNRLGRELATYVYKQNLRKANGPE